VAVARRLTGAAQVIEIPGGLHDSTRRPRHLRVVSNGNWYLAAPGLLAKVGFGELAIADLDAVAADLGERVFVAHPEVKQIERHLGPTPPRLTRRLRWFEGLSEPFRPGLNAIARGAQVAVLPAGGPGPSGVVWVDGERVFGPGEVVPLPWTDPLVSLTVVRPRAVAVAMRAVIGPGGPKRASLPEDA
jgi:hypothetical protein